MSYHGMEPSDNHTLPQLQYPARLDIFNDPEAADSRRVFEQMTRGRNWRPRRDDSRINGNEKPLTMSYRGMEGSDDPALSRVESPGRLDIFNDPEAAEPRRVYEEMILGRRGKKPRRGDSGLNGIEKVASKEQPSWSGSPWGDGDDTPVKPNIHDSCPQQSGEETSSKRQLSLRDTSSQNDGENASPSRRPQSCFTREVGETAASTPVAARSKDDKAHAVQAQTAPDERLEATNVKAFATMSDATPFSIDHNISDAGFEDESGNAWLSQETPEPRTILDSDVVKWRGNIPGGLDVNWFHLPQHWRCDIDTDNGEILPPINYPDTLWDEKANRRSVYVESQRNMTSKLYMMKKHEMHKRHRNLRGLLSQKSRRIGSSTAAHSQSVREERLAPTPITRSPVQHREEPPDPFAPTVPCYMRPAALADMEGVRDIYNWEVANGKQAMDVKPLSKDDFVQFGRMLRANNLPFLVVVLESKDVSCGAWGREVVAGKKPGDASERIIGFGFLSIYERGLMGAMIGTGRLSAKANVFVHHEYRRNKIGGGILDKLMHLSAQMYSPRNGIKYVNPNNESVYNSAKTSPLQVHRLYIEVLLSSAGDEETEWYESFLGMGFQFNLVTAKGFPESHRSRPDENAHWLDKFVYCFNCTGPGTLVISGEPQSLHEEHRY